MIETVNEKPDTGNIKQLPYGVTDYDRIRQKNFYYIDKTAFLTALETVGRYLFFIRPRCFGKSLFISMLKAYYDVAYKDRFDEFFKGTWIYDHPTEEIGKYLLLDFNFSEIDPDPTLNNEAFLSHVQNCVVNFLQKYEPFLSTNPEKEFFADKIRKSKIASDILSSLFHLCAGGHQKLYVIIDEYDNFANTILSDVGSSAYHKLTHGIGQFRAFFNVLKAGTTSTEAPVTRTFISGVSPITMDDVTSGYNIGKNVSLRPAFNRMLGFTGEEVVQMIEYYKAQGIIKESTLSLLEIFRQRYGNYLFSKRESTRMYNPDMVLYFLDQYISDHIYPRNLVDRNVRIDYGKLRHLIVVDRNEKGQQITTSNGNFSKLKEIIRDGETTTEIIDGFPLDEVTKSQNFKSLLFYLGLLTIKEPYYDQVRLEIPNETIRHLFYDYIVSVYRETGVFSLDFGKYKDLMTAMAYNGKWKALFDFVTGCMKESMSLRDLMTGEKAIQAFLNVYLGLSNLYIIHPEREANKGYADILMEPVLAQYPDIQYSYMIEIKYMKRAAAQPSSKAAARPPSKPASEKGKKPPEEEIKKLVVEAENQLRQYCMDEKLTKTLAKTTLIKLVLVFCGHEAVTINEVK